MQEPSSKSITLTDLKSQNEQGLMNKVLRLKHFLEEKSEREFFVFQGSIFLMCNELLKMSSAIRGALSQNYFEGVSPYSLSAILVQLKNVTHLVKEINEFAKKLPKENQVLNYLKVPFYRSEGEKYNQKISEAKTRLIQAFSELNINIIFDQMHDQKVSSQEFDQDENRLIIAFKDSRSKMIQIRNPSSEPKKESNHSMGFMLKKQITSLKSCIKNKPKPDYLAKLDSSLIIPLCDIILKGEFSPGSGGNLYIGEFRKRRVLVKTFEGIAEDNAERTFFNEVQAISSIRSEYTVQLYGICWENKRKYLVTEYMKNGSLYSYLRKALLDTKEKLSIALDIAQGLYDLSFADMVHSNLNSHNVMISDSKKAKINDFSCAKSKTVALTSVIDIGQIEPLDLFAWKAPEVLNCAPATFASDVYSFGIILLELFGCRPYECMKGGSETIDKIKNDIIKYGMLQLIKSDTPENLNNVPSAICKIVENCLRFSPDKRQSIGQIIDTLRSLYKEEKQKQKKQGNSTFTQSLDSHSLGVCYFYGKQGYPVDERKAYKHFVAASEAGNLYSKLFLAEMCAKGIGTNKNMEQAMLHYYALRQERVIVEKCSNFLHKIEKLLFPIRTLNETLWETSRMHYPKKLKFDAQPPYQSFGSQGAGQNLPPLSQNVSHQPQRIPERDPNRQENISISRSNRKLDHRNSHNQTPLSQVPQIYPQGQNQPLQHTQNGWGSPPPYQPLFQSAPQQRKSVYPSGQQPQNSLQQNNNP